MWPFKEKPKLVERKEWQVLFSFLNKDFTILHFKNRKISNEFMEKCIAKLKNGDLKLTIDKEIMFINKRHLCKVENTFYISYFPSPIVKNYKIEQVTNETIK